MVCAAGVVPCPCAGRAVMAAPVPVVCGVAVAPHAPACAEAALPEVPLPAVALLPAEAPPPAEVLPSALLLAGSELSEPVVLLPAPLRDARSIRISSFISTGITPVPPVAAVRVAAAMLASVNRPDWLKAREISLPLGAVSADSLRPRICVMAVCVVAGSCEKVAAGIPAVPDVVVCVVLAATRARSAIIGPMPPGRAAASCRADARAAA